ncbi:MAG TPA: hypothetical protein VJO16_02415 [Candidatus Acidoferrum sp.]|nr:hypothetical protein [Candidatus Acidoferrum sp.]
MKAAHITKLLVVVVGFATLATPRARAQSEIDPDHFDAPNTEPFSRSKVKVGVGAAMDKVRFSGKFKLPYSLRCAGKTLPPGNYSLSISSDGKTGRVRLNQKSQTLEIVGAVRLPPDPRARNTLLVECIGKAHRLSAIHVREMELVFAADPQLEHTPDGKPMRTERLLLTRMSPQN